MKIFLLSLAILFSALVSVAAHAESYHYGCKIDPKDLPAVGTRAVKASVAHKQKLNDSMIVQADIEGEAVDEIVDSEEIPAASKITANWEGFYRPQEDGFYSLLPIPLLGFELSRMRNVIYVCAHIDPDLKKQHFTIYLMRGYHIDSWNLETIIGDLLHRPKLEVKGLAPVLVPFGSLSQTTKKFPDFIRLPFKIFDWQFAAYGGIQRMIFSMMGDISGIAIERIVLTDDTLELASGVDLENPSKARWTKRINLKDAEN